MSRVNTREEAQVNAFRLSPSPTDPTKVVLDAGPGTKLPLDYVFAILVGEICYNLRSALDYLVYELAILDSGSVKRTQFPIDKAPAAFSARQRPGNFLDGVNSVHVATLERLQPYNGCRWTEDLQSISNPDKHRTLVGTKGEHSVQVDVSEIKSTLEAAPGIIRSVIRKDGTETFVRLHIATVIQFSDGSLVLEPLKMICDQVKKTLDDFRSEFS